MAAIVKNLQGSYTVRTGIDVSGSELNDTIVNGAYPEDSLVGANSIDEYKGHNISISGNEGKDVILNHGYNVTVSGGDGNDSIRNFGSNVRISGNEGSDKFIISGASENNTITDFTEGEDELWFEQGAVTAEIDTYYTKHSVVIKSAETGDTLVRLEGVTSGSSNKIVWYKDDGGTMSTNINWLLANSATTDSDIKNITVKANGKLNNTLDNAIITATTGNNSIENSGNKITINGGSGNDTIKNSGSDVKINGNDGDDSVNNNGGNNVTIEGGKGNDTIFNSGNDVSIFGGEGKDSIRINAPGTKVTVDGGDDDDDINNSGSSALISGGAGNDSLTSHGDNTTINGGMGNDAIHNSGTSVIIFGGTGNDETSNTGDNVTIDAGEGNDSIDNIGSNVSIHSGDGDDTITNRGTNATNITINSGNGDDSISNLNSNVTIISGSGDDTIYNDGSNVLIDSGTGNDSIHNRAGSNITFNYRNGDGNDTIEGLKEFPTINISGGSYSSLTSGDDVILKVGEGSITLKDAKGTSLNIIGTYTPGTTTPDNPPDVEVSFISYDQLSSEELQQLKETSINSLKTLIDSFEEMNITSLTFSECDNDPNFFSKAQKWTKLTVFIAKLIKQNFPKFPDWAFSTLSTFDGLLTKAKTVEIFSASGEFIYSTTKDIFSGSVDWEKFAYESPLAYAYFTYVLGLSSNAGITSLEDNEKRQSLEHMVFSGIDWGFNAFLKKLGNDAIRDGVELLTRLGTQSNAAAQNMRKAIKLKVTTGKASAPFGPVHITISALAGLVMGIDQYNVSKSQYVEDQIPNSTRDALIDATATGIYEAIHSFTYGGDDAIIQIGAWIGSLLTGNEPFNIEDYGDNWVELIARDIKYHFLNGYTGTNHGDIMLSTKDGEMIYGEFGNDHITNNHSNMTIYAGADDDTVISTSETHDNYINLGLGNDSIHMYDNKSTVYGSNGKDTILVTGNDFEKHIIGNEIFGDSGQDFIRLVNVDNSSVNAGTDNDYILLQNSNGNTITGGYGHDYIEFQASNNNIITYRPGNGKDVIVGYNESDTIKLTRFTKNDSYNSTVEGNDIVVKIGDGQILLKDAKGQKLNIESSFILEPEDVKSKPLEINPIVLQEVRNSIVRANTNASGDSTTTYITNDGETSDSSQNAALKLEIIDNTLVQTALNARPQIYALGSTQDAMDWVVNTSSGDDSITADSNKNSTLSTGAGNDTIVVFGTGNVYANAGSGNDFVQITSNAKGKTTVEGGKGSDTLNNSGASNVLFKYTAGDGNDIITGFNSTSTLSIGGAKYSSNVSGDDLIFSVGKEKITLVGANNLSIVNIAGTSNTTQPATTAPDTIPAETTTLTITDSTKSLVTLNSAVKMVDASSRTTAVKITGNSNANSIVGGSGDDAITGEAGNDTLNGRTGDDTLTGGSGSDLFVYSAGNDVITDYSSGDKVSLTTAISSSSLNGSDVILTTKNGSLTIQNSKGKTLNLIDSAGKNYSTIIGGSSSETSLPVNQNTNKHNTQNDSSSTSTTINSDSSTPTVTANTSSSVSSSSNAPVISYIYTGGDQVIDNYISEQKIALGTLPNGYIFGGGNFALTSDNGTLFISNAYDKIIDFVDGTGNPFAKAYAATNPGVIDGRGIAGFEVIAGSDLGSDFIFAGDGSSSLWGGNGSDSDTLVGGGGTDIFLGSKYAGNDIFVNASATDLIHLGDVLLSDVIATAEVDNAVAVAFNTGNVIMAGSTEPLSAAFILADGSAYRFNHVTKVWQNA